MEAWRRQLAAADAGAADLLHLHHLTPINEAAERDHPRHAADRPPARHRAADAAGDRRGPARGLDARRGVGRPDAPLGGGAASGCSCSRPTRCAGCPTCSACRRSGWCGRPTASTPTGFQRRPVAGEERLAHWRRWLVEEPRGWDESGRARQRGLPRRGARGVPRRRAGAALRGPLHLGQAHPAPDPRPRPRAGPLRPARATGPARRLPGRVGGPAPAGGRARDRRSGRVPGRLARPRGPARPG